MKKIVSAVALAAVAASLATAEVKVNLNGRMQNMDMFNYTKPVDGDATTDSLNLGKGTDTLKFAAKESFGGVQGEITVGTDNSIKTDKYWAWLNWGNFTLTGGNRDNRYMTRLNGTAVDGLGLVDSNTSKFGISKTIIGKSITQVDVYGKKATALKTDDLTSSTVTVGSYGSTFGVDFDDNTAIGGSRKTSLFGAYTLKDALPGDLLLEAGILTNTYKVNDDVTQTISSGFVGRVGYNQKDTVKADVVVQLPEEKVFGIGAYVQPLMLPSTFKLVAGFTFVNNGNDDATTVTAKQVSAGSTYTVDGETVLDLSSTTASTTITTTYTFNKYNAFAADLQMQVTPNDQLNAILQGKFTRMESKGDFDVDPVMALEVAAEVAYKINDNLTAALDGAVYMNDLTDVDEAKCGQNTLVILPAASIKANKNAYLNVGVKYTQALDTDKDVYPTVTKMNISVPMVLRIKL